VCTKSQSESGGRGYSLWRPAFQPMTWRHVSSLPGSDERPTYEPVDEDEEQGEQDEARVPHPDALVDGGDAEEDEDDGLRAVGEHLHGVLHGRHRRRVHVGLDVALARDAAEHDAGPQQQQQQ